MIIHLINPIHDIRNKRSMKLYFCSSYSLAYPLKEQSELRCHVTSVIQGFCWVSDADVAREPDLRGKAR